MKLFLRHFSSKIINLLFKYASLVRLKSATRRLSEKYSRVDLEEFHDESGPVKPYFSSLSSMTDVFTFNLLLICWSEFHRSSLTFKNVTKRQMSHWNVGRERPSVPASATRWINYLKYLAIYNNENLPNSITFLPKLDQDFPITK